MKLTTFPKLAICIGLGIVFLNGQQIDYVTQIKNKPAFTSSDFDFSRLNGSTATGDLSTAGLVSVTIKKCPLGVAGTNTNHYIYINGGAGTPEASLIVGGTCTSGAASGTLLFNTVNNHTGNWKINSATSGIQEAVWAASPVGSVIVSSGTHTIYAGITVRTTPSVNQHVGIAGQSRAGSVIVSDSTFTGTSYGFLFDDSDNGSNKFQPGQYGLTELTLDFRATPSIDILQIGTPSTLGIGHGGAMFSNLNYWGGKRWIYAPGASDKIWITNSYFNKATTDYDGIWVDVTTPRAGFTFANLEIATDASVNGSGNAVNLYCNSLVDCNFTNFNMIQVLGKWRSALKADNVAISPPTLAVGFYVLINFWVSEMYAGDSVIDLHDVAFSQIENSWFSNFTASGSLSAVTCDNCFEIRWNGDYFNSSAGAGDIRINQGGRHMFTGNRFIGATKAFHFDSTPVDGQGSVIGFNHYRSVVHNQNAEWALFIKPNNTITQRPVLSPFTLQMNWSTGDNQMLMENIESGAVTPKKYFGVDPEGSFSITNDAATAVIFRARDSGVVETGSMNFATLSGEFPSGSRFVRCSNCTPGSSPCTGSGTGAWAFGTGVFWTCPF